MLSNKNTTKPQFFIAFISQSQIQMGYTNVCPESVQPCTMKRRHLLKKIREPLYLGQWLLSPFKVGTLGTHTVLPGAISCPVVFSLISLTVWYLFPFKGDSSFGKVTSHRVPNLGYSGAESPRWFAVSPKNVMHEQVHSCGLLYHPDSFCGGMFKLNAKYDADSLLSSLIILNVMVTQYTCSLRGVYHPHWLVQRSHHCSCTYIPFHSPRLPGYINVVQTVLIILTMIGHLPGQTLYSLVLP